MTWSKSKGRIVRMMSIGVLTNREKDINLKYTSILVGGILGKGAEVNLCSDISLELNLSDSGLDEENVIEKSEILICLGGDGTFLKYARKAYNKGIPMLGINLGSLGFLTEVEKTDLSITVECLINGNFEIEERIMLESSIISDGKIISKDVALNDVVISRGALSRILHIKTYINNDFVDTFPGDGVIVSSPTGSTAYSLSCGGPIVEPDLDLMIVTPICPHILYSRSFITAGDRVVKLVVDENYCHDAMVTIDGQEGIIIRGGDYIEVKKAPCTVKLIRINSRNFFNILRTKIYDRGERLSRDEI
jgi:NAD+ kinase